jgi:signal transduction histidine kinase
VSLFLGSGYYITDVLKIENLFLVVVIGLFFVILSGIFISKLAVDPLLDYVNNLQNLSKETLHELNLPISTITTNSQLLKKNINDDKSKKRLERIQGACDMLKQRYNELDYHIKMQTKQAVKEKFFVDELVQERIDFLQRIYPQMKFMTNLQKVEIESDKTGLAKVIDNIIDNGVKYSDKSDSIEINLNENSLSIKDHGIGMDEMELLHIFDRYYQTNKDMQGFGIGLSMVKRFCDTNNIDLAFESVPKTGTTVKLTFKK